MGGGNAAQAGLVVKPAPAARSDKHDATLKALSAGTAMTLCCAPAHAIGKTPSCALGAGAMSSGPNCRQDRGVKLPPMGWRADVRPFDEERASL